MFYCDQITGRCQQKRTFLKLVLGSTTILVINHEHLTRNPSYPEELRNRYSGDIDTVDFVLIFSPSLKYFFRIKKYADT